jgi:hypothetical protein
MLNKLFPYFYNIFFRLNAQFCVKVRQLPPPVAENRAVERPTSRDRSHDFAPIN